MKRNGVLVLVIALFCVASALIPYVFTSKSVKEAFNSASFSVPEGETERAGEKGETFAVWIASVYNLNYPTK